ncbi:MAG: hypothetical protein JW958_03730 [Candidatus Eisenbacteria bacterium]|nr:hypothetical protein [Candidatus Eisenbacteria bacterium]
MTRNRLVGVLFLAFLLAALASTAFATESRVAALGGRGIWLRDDSNVSYFPGTIVRYNERAISELRFKDATEDSYTIGVHFPVQETNVFGVYLNSPIDLPVFPDDEERGNMFAQVSPTDLLNNASYEQTLTFYYGMPMSSFDFAVGLTVGLDSYKNDPGSNDVEESTRYIAVSAGLSNEKMDLGLQIDLPGQKWESGDNEQTWGGVGLGVAGRFFLGEEGETRIVPVCGFGYSPTTYEVKSGGNSMETDLSEMDLLLGVAVNKPINEKNLIILGLELFGYHTAKMEDSDPDLSATRTVMTLPGFYVGFESQIQKWLTGRIGAVERFQSTKYLWEGDGVDDYEITMRDSDLDITFGLSMEFKRFVLDAVINEDLLFDGPNFVSGTTEVMANRLSVSYLWD